MAPPYSYPTIPASTTYIPLPPAIMSPSTTSARPSPSLPASALKNVHLGREQNKIAIRIPTCPDSSAKPSAKAHAFTLTETAIKRHVPTFEFAELAECLAEHIPGEHAYSYQQVQDLTDHLLDQPFLADNLVPLGFPLGHHMVPSSVGWDPAHTRPVGLLSLRVQFSVDFKSLALDDTTLASIPRFEGHYDIPLPQSPVPSGRILFPARTGPPEPARIRAMPDPARTGPHATPAPARNTGLFGILRTAHRTVGHFLGQTTPTTTPGPADPVLTPYDIPSPTLSHTTFVGDLFFLTDQDAFDQMVSARPPLPDAIRARWNQAVKSVLWNTFSQLLRHHYVGTLDSVDNTMSVEDITDLFRDLKMVPVHAKGSNQFLDPDSLFNAFTERLSALSDDATDWPIILCQVYYQALPKELRDKLESDEYKLPRPSTLLTKAAQYNALAKLRVAAATSWRRLSKERDSLLTMLGPNVKSFICATKSPAASPERKVSRRDGVTFSDDTKPPADTTATVLHFKSPAEQTISKYKSPGSGVPDSSNFPLNPFTGYRSRFHFLQKCCFVCGPNPSPPHDSFHNCPLKDKDDAKAAFRKELFCHSKKFRDHYHLLEKKEPLPSPKYTPHDSIRLPKDWPVTTTSPSNASAPAPAPAYQPQLYPPQTQAVPAYNYYPLPYPGYAPLPPFPQYPSQQPPAPESTHPPSSTSTSAPAPAPSPAPAAAPNTAPTYTSTVNSAIPPPTTHPRVNMYMYRPSPSPPSPSSFLSRITAPVRSFVSRIRCFSAPVDTPRPVMPVAIDMGLPTITIPMSSTVSLSGLFDSCGSLNLGWLPYHLFLMSKCPELVNEFRYYDGYHPFQPIHLSGAVCDPNQPISDCGKLTALIRYKTDLKEPDGTPITLSFALGPDVSANTIIGLPFLRQLKFITDYDEYTAFSKVLQQTFQLTCNGGDRCMPDAASGFDAKAFLNSHLSSTKSSFPTSHSPAASSLMDPTIATVNPPSAGFDDMSQGFLRRYLCPSVPPQASQSAIVQRR